MGTPKRLLYAAIGAGELAIDKARKASESFDLGTIRKDVNGLRSEFPKRLTGARTRVEKAGNRAVARGSEVYEDLVKRGKKTVLGIRNSGPTKRAVAQTKTARRQTRAAVTSVRKATAETAQAAKEAATHL